MAKPWPYTTDTQLKEAGYRFDRRSRCNAKYKGGTCNQEIEWWHTPDGKMMPIDPGLMTPHWSTCPDADLFRKPKRTP